jgi:hypothetical protein
VRFRVPSTMEVERKRCGSKTACHGRSWCRSRRFRRGLLRRGGRPTYNFAWSWTTRRCGSISCFAETTTFEHAASRSSSTERLGVPTPQFAHVPMVLGPGRRAVLEAPRRDVGRCVGAREGVPPEALVNGLASSVVALGRPHDRVLDGHRRRVRSRLASAARLRSSIRSSWTGSRRSTFTRWRPTGWLGGDVRARGRATA